MSRCASRVSAQGGDPLILRFKKLCRVRPQVAEDLQEEGTKPPTYITVTKKQGSVAAEWGCPQTHTFYRGLPKVDPQN